MTWLPFRKLSLDIPPLSKVRTVQVRSLLTAAVLWLSAIVSAMAQSEQAQSRVSRWRFGLIVTASGGACQGLNGYMAVPADWPEQQASIVRQDISPEVKVGYEIVDGGAKIMNVRIPQLASGRKAHALLTFELRRNAISPPLNTSIYVLPDPTKLAPAFQLCLAPSPMIQSRAPKIRQLAQTLAADKQAAWQKVEALYDWVCENIAYEDGPWKGALAAVNDGRGDCEERSAAFIALCRSAGIPARTVWVPDHCYSEFYLEDDQRRGYWFPCQSAGTPTFGEITEFLPILQKGDNFRPPKPGMERQRYMAEFFAGMTTPGGGKPQVKFIREQAAE